ncbi:MAG: TolC family protein [Gemmatimonadales bacterium]
MKTVAFLVLLVVAQPVRVSAQAQQPDSLRLTLDEALRIARATNPAYRQAANQASLNATESRTTWFDQVLPRATLNLFGTNFYGNVRRRAQDNFGNPIENPSADWVYFSETSQSLQLDWQIQGTSLFNTLDRQRLLNRSRTLAESRALTELDVQVERAYWEALEQEELRRAEEELLDAREVDLRVAERLFGLAMRTRVDILRSELAIEQQRLTLGQQTASAERAKLALRTLLGDDELPPFELTATPIPTFDPSGLSVAPLVDRARGENLELRQAGVAVESARVEVSDSNRRWWPTLFANYNVTRRAQTPEGRALFDFTPDEPLDHRFFVGLQVPAFTNYFGNRQASARASVALDNASEAERETRLRVEETVRGALLELESQWEALAVAERAGEIASEALELAREEYRLGTRTFEALRQSIDEEAATRRQLIQSRYAFADALLDLEEAVGARIRD